MSEQVDEFFQAQHIRQSDPGSMICPYCSYAFQPEAEDYSEDPRTKECSECGKNFQMYQVFSVDHVAKPDCKLNGAEHQWYVRPSSNYRRCKICDCYGGVDK